MIAITARAKKGAATRTLAASVSAAVQRLDSGAPADRGQVTAVIHGCRAAANKLIAAAAAGELLTIQITVSQGPLGGWNGSVMVDAEPAEPR